MVSPPYLEAITPIGQNRCSLGVQCAAGLTCLRWRKSRRREAPRHFLVKTEASEDAERPPSLAIRSAGYRSQLERPPRLTVIATSKIRIRRDHFLSKTRRPRLWPETEDKHGIGPGWALLSSCAATRRCSRNPPQLGHSTTSRLARAGSTPQAGRSKSEEPKLEMPVSLTVRQCHRHSS